MGKHRITAAALVAIIGLSACSGADEASDSGMDAATAGNTGADDSFDGGGMAEEPRASADGDSAEGGDGGLGGASLTIDPAALGRQIIRTANLDLLVTDVEQAAAEVSALVARFNGFISSAEIRGRTDDRDGWGVIVLRVPTDRLDAAVGDLRDIAEDVEGVQFGSEDVSDTYADIEARLTNLRALETELVALLQEVRERTNSAQEVLVVFNQVANVRSEIESLEGRQASLDNRIALATITVNLAEVPEVGPDPADEPEPSAFDEALQTTKDGFATIGVMLVWFGVTVLPLGAVVLLPIAAIVWLFRRREDERAQPRRDDLPPPTPPASSPEPEPQPRQPEPVG